MKYIKTFIFSCIILIPLLLLVTFVSTVAYRIYGIRNIDYEEIYSELKEYLDSDKGEVAVTVKDHILSIDYDNYIDYGIYKPPHREIAFDPRPSDFLIYIYGSSLNVSKPPFYKGDFPHFPSVLQSRLNGGFEVYNLGMVSFDSFDVKKIIEASVDCKRPDLIIYYDVNGSDFQSAYGIFIERFYVLRDPLKRLLDRPLSKIRIPNLGKANKLADWFLKGYLDPHLLNLFQRFHLIKIDQRYFKEYNRLIMDHYKKNIRGIIEFSQSRNIPLVILVGVGGNLELRPFGIYDMTDEYYERGMAQKDYAKKMEYLLKAKDSEIFTLDLEFKSATRTFLDNIKEKNVYVLDLQEKLMDARFEFNHEYFYDYGHMKPALHGMIADYVYEFLRENKLL